MNIFSHEQMYHYTNLVIASSLLAVLQISEVIFQMHSTEKLALLRFRLMAHWTELVLYAFIVVLPHIPLAIGRLKLKPSLPVFSRHFC